MKTPLCLAVAATFVAFAFPAQAERAAVLPIESALKLAQDYLKGQPNPPTVVALTLQDATIRGRKIWYARWSSAIIGGEKPEIGLQIEMNGDLVKVVTGAGEPGPGRRRYGVRDMR